MGKAQKLGVNWSLKLLLIDENYLNSLIILATLFMYILDLLKISEDNVVGTLIIFVKIGINFLKLLVNIVDFCYMPKL